MKHKKVDMYSSELLTIKDIVMINREKREKERNKSKERTAAFRNKLNEYLMKE